MLLEPETNNLKNLLKKSAFLKLVIKSLRVFRNKNNVFEKALSLTRYYQDYISFKKSNSNPQFSLSAGDIYPCIFDKTSNTPVGAVYFYQDTWCAKKVFETKPKHHHDIGSLAELVGIISQFIPTTMIDIRPIGLDLSNLSFIKGDIKNLPFADKTIESLSSICVIEHIGLGRYGDELDAFGSEKAATELVRVLASKGNLFISVPIDSTDRIYFNAHRAFSRDYILKLFDKLTLREEKYIYGDTLVESYDPKKGFGTGLYHFTRE